MAGTEEEVSEILRSLEDGWHYRPDWRNRVVACHLVEKGIEVDALEVLKDEHDPFVRQFYLFRRSGGCLRTESFRWAYRCHAHDATTGAAALIKALAIAKVPVKEIAHKLRTTSKNIAVFLKLYFDVEPYLDDKAWLASIVFSSPQGSPTVAEFREQHWLAAALLGGREGLERAITPNAAVTNDEREKLVEEIRAALTVRAHNYISSLQCGLVPPGPDDFERLLRMLDTTARQPFAGNRGDLMGAFIQGINGVINEKSGRPEFVGDTVLAECRDINKVEADHEGETSGAAL